jgi:hypothetical protein
VAAAAVWGLAMAECKAYSLGIAAGAVADQTARTEVPQ